MTIRYFGPIQAHVNESEKVITLRLKGGPKGGMRLSDYALSSLVSWAVSEYQEELSSGFYMDFSEVEHLVNPGEFGREDGT